MLKKLLSHLGEYRKFALIGPVCVLIDIICEVFIPRVMAMIVDVGIPGRDVNYILRMGAIMVILALVAIAAGSTNSFLSSRASQGMGYNLRKALFEKVQQFSFSNVDKFSTASLVTRTTSDVNSIQMATMMGLRLMIRSPIMLISAIFMSFNISAELTVILLFSLPILAIGVILIIRNVMPLFIQTQKRLDRLSTVVQENLIGIRAVKAYVREDHEKAKFKQANDDYMMTAMRAMNIIILIMPLMMLVLNGTTVATLWQGGVRVGAGRLSAGDLMSFLSYITQILISLIMLSMVFIMVARARASGERVIEVLETEADIKDNETAILNPTQIDSGAVSFKNVYFRYGADAPDDILSDINLSFSSGEFIAIVGSTGAGKTSLVNLIPRFYDATEGCVFVDGKDVRDVPLEALRDAIGVVLQKNVLFSGTIRDNIKWGKSDASDEEVIAAAKSAEAHDFIMSFPNGYDSLIDQGGTNVSGGQRQRLCIARAMIKKPKILILDDSTSAIDTDTESRIRQAFHRDLKDTTIFVVAQRISSVRHADKIVIMDEGKIVGIGKHEDLIKTNAIYQEINKSQNEEVE